jgi:hypothetical protein
MKLSKSASRTLEMLHEAFGEHSLSQTTVFNDIHISRLVECQPSVCPFGLLYISPMID